MRLEALIAALILFGGFDGSARADLQGLPQFSAAETQTIARNELLNAVVAADPWLVRRMLDILARQASSRSDEHAVSGTDANPVIDPDLSISPRDWQGTVEWNELIKRARAEKEARDKQTPAASGRSSEGTVQLIDLMRRAKAKKDASGAQ